MAKKRCLEWFDVILNDIHLLVIATMATAAVTTNKAKKNTACIWPLVFQLSARYMFGHAVWSLWWMETCNLRFILSYWCYCSSTWCWCCFYFCRCFFVVVVVAVCARSFFAFFWIHLNNFYLFSSPCIIRIKRVIYSIWLHSNALLFYAYSLSTQICA